MFFKKRYFRSSRFSKKFLYLFNLFFNFNNCFFEFLGNEGFLKLFSFPFLFNKENGGFLKIFSLNNKICSNNGYMYVLVLNLIKNLVFGYEKKIIIFGLGYKAILRSKFIHFYLCYSHPIIYNIPEDVKIEIKSNEITVQGLDKQRVGEVSLRLRNFKKPDKYKGKGLRYLNEKIVLKPIKKK